MNDYVKNYIGEGKAHKRFAADYLEKRSQVKNALKNNNTTADDLTSPATALSHDLEFQVLDIKFENIWNLEVKIRKTTMLKRLSFLMTYQNLTFGLLNIFTR